MYDHIDWISIELSPDPVPMICPRCNVRTFTETRPIPGLLTYLLVGSLFLFGCWFGCCLIPCCIGDCQDIEHRCPRCFAMIGRYRRL